MSFFFYYIGKLFVQTTVKKWEMISSNSSLVRISKIHHPRTGCKFVRILIQTLCSPICLYNNISFTISCKIISSQSCKTLISFFLNFRSLDFAPQISRILSHYSLVFRNSTTYSRNIVWYIYKTSSDGSRSFRIQVDSHTSWFAYSEVVSPTRPWLIRIHWSRFAYIEKKVLINTLTG